MALPKYTQTELADAIAEKVGGSRSEAKRFLDAAFEVAADALAACERVEIAGVVIAPALKAATKKRVGRNPQTGEEVQIAAKPASVRVAVRATKKLKQHVPTTRKLQNAL